MNVKYGISAINWVNEDIKEFGDHYTAEQVLTEMSRFGFAGTEFCRKFPRQPEALKELLARYNMELTSQWKSVYFSDPARHEEEMKAFREHADFLKAMGCKYVVTCDGSNTVEDLDNNTVHVKPLNDEQWKHMVDGLHQAGQYCADQGMELVYHFHGETVVETSEDIHRLMESTDPRLVHLLYDTGHAYYGGSDPLEILQTYYERIRYIHLKDVRHVVLEWQRKTGLRFREAVRRGIFTVPGDGCIDFAPIFKELQKRGYEGWLIVEAEQDPSIASPAAYAEKAMTYIQSLSS